MPILPTIFDEVGYTPDQTILFYSTWQRLLDECMAASGFDEYQPIQLTKPDLVKRKKPDQYDRVEVSQFGFGEPPALGIADDQRSEDLESEAYQAAFLGDGEYGSGCSGRTFSLVYGDNNQLDHVGIDIEEIDSIVMQRTIALQEFKVLSQEWSRCMKDRGFTFDSREDLSRQDWASGPKAQEIETALADYDCRAAVDYPKRFERMYLSQRDLARDEFAVRLQDLKAAAMGHVRRVLQLAAPTGSASSPPSG